MTTEIEFIKQNLLYENLLEGFILAQMIFDEIGQPIDYRILEVNTSSLTYTNLKQKQVLGHKTRELFNSIKCKWVEIFGNVVQSGKSIKFEIYSQDLNRWFKVQAYSLYKDHQFIVIFEDISEHKNTEKILILGDEETIQESEKRALALVEELRRMDQNKNQFLSMLSHELRNPLASIMMSVSLLDRVTFGGEQFRQAKEIIERQTNQLSRLVDDLLDVTRITQNKISLKKENVNLNELISRALEDYKELLASKGVELEVELTSVPLHIEADPARLTQAIGNLLNNAAKFTAKGDTVQVSIRKDEDKQEAVICVKDEGLGIKPDILPDLFLPFIQVDSSLDRSSGGLGLGLAIVKGMVELHGGSVAAVSEGLGKGAQFTICLPLPAIPKNKQEKQQQPNGKLSRTLRILVIDDIPDVAEIICSLLRLLGHEVISANSGREGIVKAKAFHPEILFCDIGMPGMNGYEVAENFHSDNELKDIFLVALTGYAQQDDLERARAAGFNRHLAKPVDLSILEQILAEVS